MVSVGYFYTVTDRCWRGVMSCFDNLGAAAPAPFRYRILAPLLEGVFNPTNEPYRAYIIDALFHGFLVALLVPGLYLWLKRFLEPSRAVLGVFILALGFMLSFQLYMPFGSTIIELVLLVFALNMIDKSFGIYALLVGVAAINRETSLVLVVLYAAWWGRAGLQRSFALAVLWAVITSLLHIVLGYAPHIYGFENTLERNLSSIAQAVLCQSPFVILWIMTAYGYPSAPQVLKWFAVIALLYGITVIVGAMWIEVRLLMVIFPLVLPTALRTR